MNGNNTGLRCDDSDVLITDNTISSNAHGIVCEGAANPTLRRNKIWSNGTGIAFADDSSADMSPCGGEDCGDCEDANSFKTSTYYHVSTWENPIYATCNYWGKSTPNPAKFYGDVYYTPYLSSDPLPTSMKPREAAALPHTYALSGNSPNPFNPTTTVHYDVPSPGGQVRIRIYNVQGQLVRTVISRNEAPGQHQVMWDGTDQRGGGVASGVYFLEMTASRFRATRKIMMLK
jgi:parallel beta-helix repeat protein